MDAPNVVAVPPVTRQNGLGTQLWHAVGTDQLANQMATTNIGIEEHIQWGWHPMGVWKTAENLALPKRGFHDKRT
tara:strand:+ start:2040 stop:2264 length:225 start_codon:yes stop_codon:yes gene_type:complete